jgi:serine/threonine protein kinase
MSNELLLAGAASAADSLRVPQIGTRICYPPPPASYDVYHHQPSRPNVYYSSYSGKSPKMPYLFSNIKPTIVAEGLVDKIYSVTLDEKSAEAVKLTPGAYVIRAVKVMQQKKVPFIAQPLQEFAIMHTLNFPLISPCATIVSNKYVWYVLKHPFTYLRTKATGTNLDLPADERIRWAQHLIMQLFYMHRMGYTHGDISTNNVLVFENEDTAQFGNFGHASSPWISSPSSTAVTLPENVTTGDENFSRPWLRNPREKEKHDVFCLGFVLAYLFGAQDLGECLRMRGGLPRASISNNAKQLGRYLHIMGVTGSTLADCLKRAAFNETTKMELQTAPHQMLSANTRVYPRTLETMLDDARCPPSFKSLILGILDWNSSARIDSTVDILKHLNDHSIVMPPVMREGEPLWFVDYDRVIGLEPLDDRAMHSIFFDNERNMQRVQAMRTRIAESMLEASNILSKFSFVPSAVASLCPHETLLAFWERLIHFYVHTEHARSCASGDLSFDINVFDEPTAEQTRSTVQAALLIMYSMHSLPEHATALLMEIYPPPKKPPPKKRAATKKRSNKGGTTQTSDTEEADLIEAEKKAILDIAHMLSLNASALDTPTPAAAAIYYLGVVKQITGLDGFDDKMWDEICTMLYHRSIAASLDLLPHFVMSCSVYALYLLTTLTDSVRAGRVNSLSTSVSEKLLADALNPQTYMPLFNYNTAEADWDSDKSRILKTYAVLENTAIKDAISININAMQALYDKMYDQNIK